MLSLRTFPLRNARYHWRSNLPVLLGVAVGAAALTGALVVGDSLRGSLRDRAERQLNGVESAYVGPRLVRTDLAEQLPGSVSPSLILHGSARHDPPGGDPVRVGRVTVIGTSGGRALGFPNLPGWAGEDPVAVLSDPTARRLRVSVGATITLTVERFSAVPRSSLLGRRGADEMTLPLTMVVTSVLHPDHPANDFSLTPNPAAALNVYVPLPYLQGQLGQPGRANALLARAGKADDLNAALVGQLTLDDWGLRVGVAAARGAYVAVESDHLTLDPPTVAAVQAAARDIGATAEPTFTYLANAIAAGTEPVWGKDAGEGRKLIPYSIVAALDPSAPAPLGPFLPPGRDRLADDEIALIDWPDSPLKGLNPGDPVTITYFKPEMEATVEEASATFRFAGYLPFPTAASNPTPFRGPTADPDITPPFPGVTDKLKIGDWDAPFDLNSRRIKPRDETFWNRHKTTPKAYITRAKGEQLFGSRFGSVTSVRVAPAPGSTPEKTADALRAKLPEKLNPDAAGLRFEPVRDRLLAASQGGTDFGGLFLMFSGLLILSALVLVGLLFRLAVERRAKEVGLLLAAGYSPQRVRRLLLTEGVAVAGIGAAVGVAAAVLYARLMLSVLTDLWPDVEVGRYLRVHVTAPSLVGGFVATVLVATVTIWFAVRGLVKVAPPALLHGVTSTPDTVAESAARRPVLTMVAAAVAGVIGVALLVVGGTRANPDERSMSFFGGGGLVLTAGLLLARAFFRLPPHGVIRGRGTGGMVALGARNARRNPTRSLLTAGLIAFAAFLVVSVESFRRKPDDDFLKPDGGSGGFRLVAEADVPLFRPFDRGEGKQELLDRLQAVYQKAEQKGGPPRAERLAKATAALDGVTTFPFRIQGGDDASCLNLFQAGRPRVLGVPDDLIDRGGFRFSETEAASDEEKRNPWLLLRKPRGEGAVPVFAEQNTAMFQLKTPVGGTLTIPDESGAQVTVRIVGTLQDNPFQSELLMSDADFRKLYPRQEGYRAFLIDVPADRQAEVANLLETGLRANGFTATPTTDRVASYQQVVGAYLTTFQLLGGFALLLAVLGLGVVLLRSVWERVGELALLRAVGYRTGSLQTMVLAETLLVLAVGLGIGAGSAVASVLPNLVLGGSLPGTMLLGLAAAVAVVGIAVAGLATAGVARAPLIPALRKD